VEILLKIMNQYKVLIYPGTVDKEVASFLFYGCRLSLPFITFENTLKVETQFFRMKAFGEELCSPRKNLSSKCFVLMGGMRRLN
jgi:hypothetical protein